MKVSGKKVIMLAVLAVSVSLVLAFMGGVAAAATGTSLLDSHRETSGMTSEACINCHPQVMTENSLDPDFSGDGSMKGIGAHRRHFLSVFLNFVGNYSLTSSTNGCGKCHVETALTGTFNDAAGAPGSKHNSYEGDTSYTTTDTVGTVIRKSVRPSTCVTCHGGYQTVSSPVAHTVANTKDNPRGCMNGTCHDGTNGTTPAVAHGAGAGTGAFWIDQRYANSPVFCARCHGELQWFQVPESNPSTTTL